MKTSKKKLSLICIFAFTFMILIGMAIYDILMGELDELTDGELLSEYPSPKNDYTAKAYLDRGGSLSRADN
ncbi:DUF5412 family protein [Lysinibacillus sp. SGAir0095]|uniref:DUF5412 family protein n=1 Tax=Lysinibacillus sp. SGAir0095 TaxID=2070463 RepID=UPI0010CD1424|nr:DUF5412 family protein [Lysinibacillus sp. SGAir0095]QCR32332.1 hypothetical protein C1N55_09160 [Lysinibacillus sp. SGAir0095]